MKNYRLETKDGQKGLVLAKNKIQAILLGAGLYPNIQFTKCYIDKTPKYIEKFNSLQERIDNQKNNK